MSLGTAAACLAAAACAQLPLAPDSAPAEPPLPRYVSADAAADAAYMRGRLFQLQGRWREAFTELQMAASLAPEDVATQRALAESALRVGNAEVAVAAAERAVTLSGDDPEARRELVNVLVATDRLERAIELLERDLDPKQLDSETALGLLSLQLRLERFDAAEQLGRRMIQQHPESIPGYLALGSVLERTGRLDDAEALYQTAFKRTPLDPRLYDGLARVAQLRGDSEREIQLLRDKLDLVPGEPATLGRLVQIHSDRGDRGALIATIEEILHYNPENQAARFQLGLLYLEAGRVQDAIDSLDAVARLSGSDPMGDQARYLLGRIFARSGQTERAVELLESIPQSATTFVEAQLALVALFQGQQRYPDSLAALDRALERSSSVPLLVQRAQLLQLSGQLEAAVDAMEELIDDNPDQAGDLYYQLGMIYTGAGQDDRAFEIVLRALEVEADNPNALNFVGYVWADKGIRLDEAESMIRRAVEQRPSDGFIIDSLGWVLYKQGLEQRNAGQTSEAAASFDGAVRELLRAQELLDPDDPTIERHLGDVYQTMLRYEDALRAYERALSLGPSSEDAAEIRREIDRLQRQLGAARPTGSVD